MIFCRHSIQKWMEWSHLYCFQGSRACFYWLNLMETFTIGIHWIIWLAINNLIRYSQATALPSASSFFQPKALFQQEVMMAKSLFGITQSSFLKIKPANNRKKFPCLKKLNIRVSQMKTNSIVKLGNKIWKWYLIFIWKS